MTTRTTNTMAIVSLVGGIAGWSIAPIAASVVAIVCGHIARKQIRSSGEEGDGLAVAGLVLGYLNVVLTCLGTAIAFAFFGATIIAMLGFGAVMSTAQ